MRVGWPEAAGFSAGLTNPLIVHGVGPGDDVHELLLLADVAPYFSGNAFTRFSSWTRRW
jgi:hypothetical protein